jgi:hypothetical protein
MVENWINLIFIGYLCPRNEDRILLCVSSNKSWIKFYLYEIRGLDRSMVDIREVALDSDSVESLYGNYILEEYIEPYSYLTRKDIIGLNEEIERTFDRWSTLLIELKEYRQFIEEIPRFQESISPLLLAERELEFHQGRVKNLKRLSKQIIANSTIVSKDINEYFNGSRIIYESRELTEMFYRSVMEDDE